MNSHLNNGASWYRQLMKYWGNVNVIKIMLYQFVVLQDPYPCRENFQAWSCCAVLVIQVVSPVGMTALLITLVPGLFFPPQAVLTNTAPAPMMLSFKAWLAVILLLIPLCLIQTDHHVVKMMMTAALWMEQLMVAHGTVSREVSPTVCGFSVTDGCCKLEFSLV